MKPLPLALAAFAVIALPGRSLAETAPAPAPATARILGEIPDGTPPPPEPPKPPFLVAANDVLETKTQQQGGRSVTIQKIAPISLPEPPAALAPLDIEDPALQQRISELRADRPRHELLVIGATVVHSQDSS